MRPESMSKRKKRERRNFTDEYKAEVVRLCQQPGKTPNGVAVELGLTPSAVMAWVKQATADAGGGGSGALTTSEREELAALRKENRQLRQEREILKRATAFFAKEGTS
jgi:transposase